MTRDVIVRRGDVIYPAQTTRVVPMRIDEMLLTAEERDALSRDLARMAKQRRAAMAAARNSVLP